MGSELLRIADGLRGLAGMEWNGAAGTAEKDVAVTEADAVVDTAGKAGEAGDAVETGAAEAGEADKKVDKKAADSKKAVAIEDVRAVMAQKTQEGKSKEIKELLQKYGAVKLSGVAPEHYPIRTNFVKSAKVAVWQFFVFR